MTKRGSVCSPKSQTVALSAANTYIEMCVCVCVCTWAWASLENRSNGDRRSANGVSSPFSIKILVLKNQCPYSVDYGFLHSYTLCRLLECLCVSVVSVASHFANSPRCHVTLLTHGAVFLTTESHTSTRYSDARPGKWIGLNLQRRRSASKFTTETLTPASRCFFLFNIESY